MRRLLRHINGTDQPTLNVYGNCGQAFRTSPGVYSCPRDFDHIMSCIEGVASDRLEIAAILRAEGFDLQDAAALLPFYFHRFVVCGADRESSTVLSIMGTDAIVYAEDLRWYLQSEFLRSGQQHAAPNAAPPPR